MGVQIQKYKTKVGTYYRVIARIEYRGIRRKKKQSKVPNKEMAVLMGKRLENELYRELVLNDKTRDRMTVASLWKEYLPISEQKKSHDSDLGRAKNLVRLLGSTFLTDLTAGVVTQQYVLIRKKENTARGTPPADATVDNEVEILNRMLNYALSEGWINKHPLTKLKKLGKAGANARMVWVTESQFELLYEQLTLLMKPIVLCGFETGMRRNEFLHLKWEQVDMKQRFILLTASDTKGNYSRKVPITDRLYSAFCNLPLQHDTWVFINPKTGRPYNNINTALASACKRAGLERITTHDLRRSFITRAREAGIPTADIRAITGHRSDAVFHRYNMFNDEHLRAAADRLNKQNPAGPAETGPSAKLILLKPKKHPVNYRDVSGN